MLPKILKPKHNYLLSRIGNENDGGYLVCKESFEKSNVLISLGLSNDIEFEVQFSKIIGSKIDCYDHTVNSGFWTGFFLINFGRIIFDKKKTFKKFINHDLKSYRTFKKFFKNKKHNHFQKQVGYKDKDISLEQIIEKQEFRKNIFIKIDIEGSEYRILEDLIKYQSSFCGCIIEFHDTDLHLDKITKFLGKFDLDLVHIHPNNNATLDWDNNPTVIELSFSKSPIIINDNLKLPNILDIPNNPRLPDIKIDFKNE